MSNEIDAYDYQRYAILFVDDEANTRKYFRRLFGEKFRFRLRIGGEVRLGEFRGRNLLFRYASGNQSHLA